ncbi:creatininase family protein [Candidatus Nitrosotenuis sp. DW1]|uniref:creatininase family protein n=1 Tax=Candidatus Nitrosotenuis sp. DW1 TaxID=2259672 RepID=UPI0015CA60A3|nr:creatininase family protein [Candidatus Nitrosotenuis sp. DW1]QLH10047.1 creatininase family protein [Candidatus Nitrosotenuis sp. DW1]
MTGIQDNFDPDLRKIIRTKKQIAIIPVGSIEQHGPHLPVSTDSDIVTEVAKRVAKKCNLLLLPTITYGVSFEHAPFFNLSVTRTTLQNQLVDICNSLVENKIRKIIILNGHHGNQKALSGVTGKISRGKNKISVISYWHHMETEFDHAGFAETSLMLAVSNKAKMSRAKKGLVTDRMSAEQKSKVSKIASTHFIKATKTGVWGDPTKATKKDGMRILSEIVQNIAKKVSKLPY